MSLYTDMDPISSHCNIYITLTTTGKWKRSLKQRYTEKLFFCLKVAPIALVTHGESPAIINGGRLGCPSEQYYKYGWIPS